MNPPPIADVATAGAALLAGVAGGWLFFASLWWQARALLRAGRAPAWLLLVPWLRLGLLGGVLALAARGGAAALLAAALGVGLGRAIVLHRVRRVRRVRP